MVLKHVKVIPHLPCLFNNGGKMARINFEDDIESRGEFWSLLEITKDRDLALGKLVRFFRLCQHRYGHDAPVSLEDLQNHGLEMMIKAGWAVPYNAGFQSIGCEKQFEWYKQKVVSGAKGNASQAKKREPNNINQLADAKHTPRDRETYPPRPPLTPSPSPSPSLTLNTITTDFAPRKAARDSFDFEIAYKEYPRKEGRAKGLLKCKAQVKTQEDFDLLLKAIRNYSNHLKRENTEKRFIKHFSTFLEAGQWRDWLEAETGKVAAPVVRAGPDKVLEELKRMDENKIPKDAQVNNAKDILATLKKGFALNGN